jgi:hypothetical protein
MNDDTSVAMYENDYYFVVQVPVDEEGYNWAVVNKSFGTEEHKTHALPAAILVCDSLATQLHSLLADAEPGAPTLPVNVVPFNGKKH